VPAVPSRLKPTSPQLVFGLTDGCTTGVEVRFVADSPSEAIAWADGFNTAMKAATIDGVAFAGIEGLRKAYGEYMALPDAEEE
jgi:hypothetical protein